MANRAENTKDYLDATGTRVTFAEGEVEAKARISIVDDDAVELVEDFIVSIFNDNEDIDLDRDETVVTIVDDDGQ